MLVPCQAKRASEGDCRMAVIVQWPGTAHGHGRNAPVCTLPGLVAPGGWLYTGG